jgi:alkaline phosphatase
MNEGQKQHLREINTGELNPMYIKGRERVGENNPFFGKTHTEENKQKMRDARKDEKHPRARKIMSKEGKIWTTVKFCAEDVGVKPNHLSNMLNGKEPWYRKLKDLELRYID